MDVIRSHFDASAAYREHAQDHIAERGIHPAIIREAVCSPHAEVIELTLDDPRGPSCLVLGWWGDKRPLHVLFGLGFPLWIITAWDPSVDPKNRWEPDFKTRRRAKEEDAK